MHLDILVLVTEVLFGQSDSSRFVLIEIIVRTTTQLEMLRLIEMSAPDTQDKQRTRRVVVPAIEALIDKKIPVGTDGFVRVVDYLGHDGSITEAARVSYTGGKTLRDDQGLINYLLRHQHTSVFEFCEIVIHVRAMWHIAKQWMRHRTANVNEISGRYTALPSEYYVPDALYTRPKNSKQGRSDERADNESGLIQEMGEAMQRSRDVYDKMVEARVAYETARVVLPIGTYTEWYWKIDVHNLLRFIRLRSHNSAQVEIQEYARAIGGIVEQWLPVTYAAFKKYQLDAVTLSSDALRCLKMHLEGKVVTQEMSGMSAGEWREFQTEVLDRQ